MSNPRSNAMEMGSATEFVFEMYHHGGDPRELLMELLGQEGSFSPQGLPTEARELWSLAFQIAKRQDGRASKTPITDIREVYSLIDRANRIVVLMGAGASSGPDFRSPGGLYDSITQSGVLEDPYSVFDLEFFRQDPSIFWRFAHLIFPAEVPQFSASHIFLEALERQGKLLRVYSQNVDTLERGISEEHLRCVHGSWRENYCMQCHQDYSMEDLRPAVSNGAIPQCVKCGGAIKPGIVFFGQPTHFNEIEAARDAQEADLLIVIGTSLQVRPISELPSIMRHVPSILINREPVDCDFNAELLGDCTDIVQHLEAALGWIEPALEAEPVLFRPNKFVFPSESDLATTVWETGRDAFLVTPTRTNSRDFD